MAKQVGICDIEKRSLTLIGKNIADVTTIGVVKGFDKDGDKKGKKRFPLVYVWNIYGLRKRIWFSLEKENCIRID